MIKLIKKNLVLLALFTISIANSQDKKVPVKKQDTIIKTEVVDVVTSYVPKITDAFKIKQKPIIKHTEKTQKKALAYTIFSAPVASTFIPKSGVMKKIPLQKRERLYPNYLSIGLANKIAPSIEAYVRRNESFNSEFTAHLKFLLSIDPVENTPLSSTFYNANLGLLYKQQERYFNWKAGIKLARNQYNWYGLPNNITFTTPTINAIDETQAHNFFKVYGTVVFDDAYIEKINGSVSLLTDEYSSSEFSLDAKAMFRFPLNGIHYQLNDVFINTSLSYLGNKFEQDYERQNSIENSFIVLGVHPVYYFEAQNLSVKIGAKAYFSLDTAQKENNIFIYPDVEVSYPIVKDLVNVFVGASGNLETNTYKSLTDENPYISPTQNLLQTNTKYEAFVGFKGRLKNKFSYNLKASYADVENNAFFALNQSKSNGNNIAGANGFSFLGYEYGNSFNVEYDDMKQTTISASLSFDGIKNLQVGLKGAFNKFALVNQSEIWNTPEITTEIFGTYKTEKWYTGANLFFVGERKGKQYDALPLQTFTTVDLKSYFDVNFNGGYHFSDSFSVFLNLNNVLNNSYQRFNNFNVQGFQVMGGLTWKFDTIF